MVSTVDVLYAVAIGQKEVIATAFCHVYRYFTDFNIAISAQDKQADIAPCRQSIRRVPIDADKAAGIAALQQHFAKILKIRVVFPFDIGGAGRDDFGRILIRKNKTGRSGDCQYR